MSQSPIAIVLGTRPEIIKLSALIRLLEKQGVPFVLIHTNQHYSAELDARFFEELELPAPHHNLNVGPGTQNVQTGRMLSMLDAVLTETNPSWVVVQGDTNSVLAGALAASKLNIPIAHVEAGLRSHDRRMPEETNRIITDHISTLLLAPTEQCIENLRLEGIDGEKVLMVGNTVVDSVMQGLELSKSVDIAQFGLEPHNYSLLTLHRPANVDDKETLANILETLATVAKEIGTPFFLPLHPRTENQLKKFGLTLPEGIIGHAAVGYTECIALEKNARFIFTDSGGIQEEACILGVPCITLRDSTERPETVTVGANRVVNHDIAAIREALAYFSTQHTWENPFGDGTTSQQILTALKIS